MPAFDFPNPGEQGQKVTNPTTGITYTYNNGVWEVTGSSVADGYATQTELTAESNARALADSGLDGRITAIEDTGAYDPTPIYAAIETEARTRQLADENLQSQIDGIDVDDIDLSDYYTKAEVDAGNNTLQLQIDDLTITKGAAAIYTLNDIGINVDVRPGSFYIDNTVAKNVKFMTLSPTDNNGNDRPLGTEGDIIELVGLGNKHYRYTITTASEGIAGVDFVTAEDPDDLLIPGTTFQVYIYPQNSSSASIDYVNAGLATKLDLTGGEMSGNLTMNGGSINTNALVKSTRTSGYAYLVYDEATSTNTSFIHSNGNGRFAQGTFTDNVEIRGDTTLKGGTTLEGNLSFSNGGTINVSSGGTVLSGRASLDIKTAADYPVVISSGSGYKKVLAIYGFDGDQDDNRGEKAYINADGKAYFSEVYANDEELATKTYVDDMGQIYYGNIVPAGSDVNDGDLWVDSGNMRLLMRASGAWVNPDREADTDEFRKYISPNGRKFGFSSGTETVTGKLNYYDSGGLKLCLNNIDKHGVKWNDGGITEDVTMSSGPYFTIWEWVNDSNHKIIRQGRISRIDYHANDILCYVSSHRTNGGFSTSKNYWVTIGGII